MLTMRFSDRGLRERVARMANRSPAARVMALKGLGRRVVHTMMTLADPYRDTNRYVNGWAMAGNSAGLGPFAVRPLQKSEYHGEFEAAVLRRLRWLQWRRSQAKPGSKRQANIERQIAEARRHLWMLRNGKLDHAAAIHLFTVGTRNKARRVQIIEKVYGGRGSWVRAGARTYLRLHNLEAHATLVERQRQIFRRSVRFAGAGLLANVKKDYLAAAERLIGRSAGGRGATL